ncbi:hypothetical protein VIBNISFn135_980148 [Vibrio nigripulchritudo SFn135]|nr:hypothetical protein VIBNISFn135_980148 [Vibrio nigripulchritudo SFn135]
MGCLGYPEILFPKSMGHLQALVPLSFLRVKKHKQNSHLINNKQTIMEMFSMCQLKKSIY